MRTIIAPLLLLLALSGPAVAADATSADGPDPLVAGATLRAQIWTGNLNEQHIWRFRPDGTVDGSMWAVTSGWRSSRHIEINDGGTWRLADGGLCVRWRRFFGGTPQCFTISPLRPGWVRLTNRASGPSFDAQLSRN